MNTTKGVPLIIFLILSCVQTWAQHPAKVNWLTGSWSGPGYTSDTDLQSLRLEYSSDTVSINTSRGLLFRTSLSESEYTHISKNGDVIEVFFNYGDMRTDFQHLTITRTNEKYINVSVTYNRDPKNKINFIAVLKKT